MFTLYSKNEIRTVTHFFIILLNNIISPIEIVPNYNCLEKYLLAIIYKIFIVYHTTFKTRISICSKSVSSECHVFRLGAALISSYLHSQKGCKTDGLGSSAFIHSKFWWLTSFIFAADRPVKTKI